MLKFAIHSASLIKPVLLQLRIIGAFSVIGLFTWSLAGFVVDVIAQAKRMHQIPCTKCRFFTGDYRLKCTVNPSFANTEKAIGCSDYRHL
ncbi:MAG: hypothetical protein AAF383_06825 [Cyanobacteria bacterium P01_A01_bin.83]